jgi:metal-sulfur cluster biosynthetic enzyme
MEVDVATRHKFDDVLARVKEPQSELSMTELGLVSKLTYSEKDKTILVYLDMGSDPHDCPACWAVDDQVRKGVERRLTEELENEFPGFTVEFA